MKNSPPRVTRRLRWFCPFCRAGNGSAVGRKIRSVSGTAIGKVLLIDAEEPVLQLEQETTFDA